MSFVPFAYKRFPIFFSLYHGICLPKSHHLILHLVRLQRFTAEGSVIVLPRLAAPLLFALILKDFSLQYISI